MELYDVLADHYEKLFPLENEIRDFLRGRFSNRVSLLDAACGTGIYTRALRERGRKIVGIDYDKKMIELAGKGAEEGAEEGADGDFPEFRFMDMRDLGVFPKESFDGIYCIGNSLPHLANLAEIGETLKGFAGRLAPKGTLVVQIVNFDRVLLQKVSGLPTLRAENIEFVRRYTAASDPDHLIFAAELYLDGPEKRMYSAEVPLTILRGAELTEAFEEAGFSEICLFGSYSGSPYREDESFLTIAEAKKTQ
jgi:SAM-dependent methyltransferase